MNMRLIIIHLVVVFSHVLLAPTPAFSSPPSCNRNPMLGDLPEKVAEFLKRNPHAHFTFPPDMKQAMHNLDFTNMGRVRSFLLQRDPLLFNPPIPDGLVFVNHMAKGKMDGVLARGLFESRTFPNWATEATCHEYISYTAGDGYALHLPSERLQTAPRSHYCPQGLVATTESPVSVDGAFVRRVVNGATTESYVLRCDTKGSRLIPFVDSREIRDLTSSRCSNSHGSDSFSINLPIQPPAPSRWQMRARALGGAFSSMGRDPQTMATVGERIGELTGIPYAGETLGIAALGGSVVYGNSAALGISQAEVLSIGTRMAANGIRTVAVNGVRTVGSGVAVVGGGTLAAGTAAVVGVGVAGFGGYQMYRQTPSRGYAPIGGYSDTYVGALKELYWKSW